MISCVDASPEISFTADWTAAIAFPTRSTSSAYSSVAVERTSSATAAYLGERCPHAVEPAGHRVRVDE